MASPLKQVYDYDLNQQPVQETAKFKVFEGLNSQDVDFQELAFFIQLSSFCVLTVMLSFFLLASQLSAFLALPLAVGASLLVVYGIKEFIIRLNK